MDFFDGVLKVLLLVVVSFVLILWWVFALDRKKKARLRSLVDAVGEEQALNFTQHTFGTNGAALAVDLDAKKLCLVPAPAKGTDTGAYRVLALEDVLSSQIQHGSVVLFESERRSGLGRALVGGALFGGAGAVAGAVTGKKNVDAIEEDIYELHITINDQKNPHFIITLDDFTTAKRWQAMFDVAFQGAAAQT